MATKPRAVVLLSGGLDSTTTAAIARAEGFALHALTFDYGQRHRLELDAARRVATALGVAEQVVMPIDLRRFGGSALTSDIAVPKARTVEEIGHGIPITYVPARNTIFLSFALAWAEVLEASDIFIGVNVLDYSVKGDSVVWVRTKQWSRLMPIAQFWALPDDNYETIGVDPETLKIGWHRVLGRFRHSTAHKRCFKIWVERGRHITVTEDHSLFTIDPATSRVTTVKGSHVKEGMPVVAPFDLTGAMEAWQRDLTTLDLRLLPEAAAPHFERKSIVLQGEWITNRLGRIRVPVNFPLTDEFLYIIGLWLAEGGKSLDSRNSALAFSIGGIPGAVETLKSYFEQFGIRVKKSPDHQDDYAVHSSLFTEIFRYVGLFGTAKRGERKVPSFFWDLSQRQRRLIVAGIWDGDGCVAFRHEALLTQKSDGLIDTIRECFLLDGIFANVRLGDHSQKQLLIGRTSDLRRFNGLYPLRHDRKRASYEAAALVRPREKAAGLWKCPGLWDAVAGATLPAGEKTKAYNAGGKYDVGVRAQRSAFAAVPSLRPLVSSRLAFLQVIDAHEVSEEVMYDLSVEGTENFIANGLLAHNSGYPDCRPEYIDAFTRMANLATKAGVEGRQRLTIHTPLIRLSKAEIIRKGLALGVDYGLTLSCYDPSDQGVACGECDSCVLRLKGFWDNGVQDPVPYRQRVSPA